MLLGRGGDHLAGPGEDVELQHRLVRHPVAEGGRLDPQTADRAAEGDRLQLRDHERRQPVRQRGCDEILVGAHPGHVGRPGVAVDRDHPGQSRGVQPGCPVLLAEAEQVGGRLGQPDGGFRRDGPIAGQEPLHAGGVHGTRHGRCSGHDRHARPLAPCRARVRAVRRRRDLCVVELTAVDADRRRHPPRHGWAVAGACGRVNKITRLTSRTQAGKTSWVHLWSPAATSRTRATT